MDDRKGVPVAGILMALCCHHRCDWSSYTGKDFMLVCTEVTISIQPVYCHCHNCHHHHHLYGSSGILITVDVLINKGKNVTVT